MGLKAEIIHCLRSGSVKELKPTRCLEAEIVLPALRSTNDNKNQQCPKVPTPFARSNENHNTRKIMSTTKENQNNAVEIERLLQQLAKAHADHDADAIVGAYSPDAVIFDLAPPLGRRGMDGESVVAWLAGWDGPIRIDARDVNRAVDGDLAFVSALNRIQGRQGAEEQDMWYRTTMCLRKTTGRWRIVCDHSSVPFYMDGSYRAAVDLQP